MTKPSKVFSFMLILCFMLMSILTPASHAQPEPDYAKWGKLAMEEVMKKYPGSQETDYEYLGRKTLSSTETQDAFDFKVVDNSKKKLVRAYVVFNPQTNKLVKINLVEIMA
ncbi:DUF3889 domain-containing protein [Ammoniphilus sp. YIM 78166]|uniref:DUF3889 domain-containing protein n=1 Tax=Ammoniphilus sp. YIM 78166 TaxID=1644106 RepID=UPI00106FEF86|nr:DUF3889 domain-containing protein [Ammoniphilus sp. YIM 78166]